MSLLSATLQSERSRTKKSRYGQRNETDNQSDDNKGKGKGKGTVRLYGTNQQNPFGGKGSPSRENINASYSISFFTPDPMVRHQTAPFTMEHDRGRGNYSQQYDCSFNCDSNHSGGAGGHPQYGDYSSEYDRGRSRHRNTSDNSSYRNNDRSRSRSRNSHQGNIISDGGRPPQVLVYVHHKHVKSTHLQSICEYMYRITTLIGHCVNFVLTIQAMIAIAMMATGNKTPRTVKTGTRWLCCTLPLFVLINNGVEIGTEPQPQLKWDKISRTHKK